MAAGGVINTDGKSTFSDLSKSFESKSKKIDDEQPHRRLYWLNKIVSVIKGNDPSWCIKTRLTIIHE